MVYKNIGTIIIRYAWNNGLRLRQCVLYVRMKRLKKLILIWTKIKNKEKITNRQHKILVLVGGTMWEETRQITDCE
jgi:hypothetical protein